MTNAEKGTVGSGRLQRQRPLLRVRSMTTENGREIATLERGGACSAYASTRCRPDALGSGRFGSRKTDEVHVGRVDMFLTVRRSWKSTGRCHLFTVAADCPGP